MYRSSEDELEHRERDGSPHRSSERDPPTMDVDEESTVGRDWRLTLNEVKAWSFGKLEGLTRPSLSGGLVKPSLSQLASRESHPGFDKFPFSCQSEVALLAQNRALQGLDESVPDEDVSIGASPLKAIEADETIFKNSLSLRRLAVRGLNVAKYYQPVAWTW